MDTEQQRYDKATADLDPPFAIVDRQAFDANAADLVSRAAGKPIRVASKSVRCRELLRDVLDRPGYAGIMAFTLAEAVWLADTGTAGDILVAYPSADRAALATLCGTEARAAAISIMVDDPAQLDLVDDVVPPDKRPTVRVCLELDASWRPAGRAHIGVRRSPVHSPAQAGALAATIAGRKGFALVGVMSYEAQIAGVGDAPPGRTLYGTAVRFIQRRSYADLLHRRIRAVDAVRGHADLEFVNAGGTGSLERTAADPAVTEVAAGSGLYGPTLFDAYRGFSPSPAALFALSVVRRPGPGIATVHGGGWVASGPGTPDRLPKPYLPPGLRLTGTEGAGEVQTPLLGAAADTLHVGDRVWFRHAKAGELCEHVDALHLIDGDTIAEALPTYRGEGKTFL